MFEAILMRNDSLLISNISFNDSYCEKFQMAVNLFDKTREINIYTTIVVIIIGLIGNILAVIVFIQKRFRKTSSEVFFLVLAISDGLFLLTHFFEDTLRTYIDFYIHRNRSLIPFPYQHCNIFNVTIIANAFNRTSVEKTSIFEFINIADKFVTTCRLVNYFRYFLRFISAYIITVFTIQRTISIYNPIFQNQFSSPKLAWKIIVGLVIVGTI